MALSNEWVKDLATDCFEEDWAAKKAVGMIRETEDQVCKQIKPLIRQMQKALELAQRQLAVVWTTPSAEVDGAIAASRKWLQENGEHHGT